MRRFVSIAVACASLLLCPADAANLRGSAMGCPPPPGIYQGSVSYTGLKPGSKATYRCQKGCTLRGNASLNCNNHGMWSGEVPSCRVTFTTKNDNKYKNNDPGYKLYSG